MAAPVERQHEHLTLHVERQHERAGSDLDFLAAAENGEQIEI
jgi:hypothetical protein